MCLRTEGVYTLGQSLGPIGWRLRKHYFKVVHKPQGGNKHSPGHSTTKHHLIKSSSQSHGKQHTTQVCVTTSTEKDYNNSKEGSGRDDLILTWTEFGPDRYIDEKEIHNVLKNFGSVQHPYIVPIEYIASNDNGALVIRKFYKQGSLKDVLCGVTSPCNPFLSKYGSPKGRAPLPLKELALYARQILEAIRFLHSKGLACGHVHCGNVQILDGVARLMDVENFLFGVPSFYRPFFVQHSKINSCESIDVYGFGHLLYEMCMGYPLQDSYARQITDCPDSLSKFDFNEFSRVCPINNVSAFVPRISARVDPAEGRLQVIASHARSAGVARVLQRVRGHLQRAVRGGHRSPKATPEVFHQCQRTAEAGGAKD